MTVRLQRDAHDSVNRCPMTSHMTIISLRGSHIIASLNPVSDDVVIALLLSGPTAKTLVRESNKYMGFRTA
jgi:hypothetical protein